MIQNKQLHILRFIMIFWNSYFLLYKQILQQLTVFFNNEIFCFIVSGTKYLLNFSSSSPKWFIS